MENDIRKLLLKSSRHHMHELWEAAKKNELDDLDDEHALLAKIMKEHEDEFYNEFEFSASCYI